MYDETHFIHSSGVKLKKIAIRDSPIGRLAQKFRLGTGASNGVSPLRSPFSVSLGPAGVDLRQGAPTALLPVEISARDVHGHHLRREVACDHALLLLGRGQQVLQVNDARRVRWRRQTRVRRRHGAAQHLARPPLSYSRPRCRLKTKL